MIETQVIVSNPSGLHARPAARLVEAAAGCEGLVEIKNLTTGSAFANAKSILGVLALGVECGHEIIIRTEVPDHSTRLAELIRRELPKIDEEDDELRRAAG